MYNLNEFKTKSTYLYDLVPWAVLIGPGTILNKDGSFQKSYRFRGPDLDSSTREELVSVTARLNNVFKRLGTGWVLYTEAQRVKSHRYPNSKFPNKASAIIDEERKNFFNSDQHYENLYYLTICYLPPTENISKWEKYFIDRDVVKEEITYQTHLKNYITESDRIFNLFQEIMMEAEPLTDEETLTYLHSTISTKRHPITVPETPMYLDAYLYDSPLIPGLEPKLGLKDNLKHLRIISIKQFPGTSVPGILDRLNRLNFEYRWVTRFICLDKNEGEAEIRKFKNKWFAKRKGASAVIKDLISQSDNGVSNVDALLKSEDSEAALQELQGDFVSYGYFTMSIIVMDADAIMVEKKAQAIEKIINSLGFVTINETVNAVDAWLGTLPGLFRSNIRRPILNTLNLAHIFPLSAVWAGPEKNNHFNAPVLMQTQTPDKTPFRLNLHIGDIGHTMIVGPSGMGKSVLLALIASQFQRYKDSQVYIFDKDGSCRVLTAGVGGEFYDLAEEKEGALSFQPLANIDDVNERSWAADWIYDFLEGENLEITPEIKSSIWTALTSLASSPKHQRTITGFTLLVQDIALKQALQPLTLNGAFGKMFDSREDNLQYGRWQVFEMATLMNISSAVPPTLSYLFHRLEQRFTGSPSLLVLDECWLFLSNPIFAEKIREWLKVLRKKNVSVVFATQSLADIAKSPVSSAIIETCLTKIYMPNPSACDQTTKPLYQDFGLNETEIRIISQATPKRQYYYKSPLGSRLFELAMGPVALAYCGSSTPQDQQMAKKILTEFGKDGFNEEWLAYKKLTEAVKKLNELKVEEC